MQARTRHDGPHTRPGLTSPPVTRPVASPRPSLNVREPRRLQTQDGGQFGAHLRVSDLPSERDGGVVGLRGHFIANGNLDAASAVTRRASISHFHARHV